MAHALALARPPELNQSRRSPWKPWKPLPARNIRPSLGPAAPQQHPEHPQRPSNTAAQQPAASIQQTRAEAEQARPDLLSAVMRDKGIQAAYSSTRTAAALPRPNIEP